MQELSLKLTTYTAREYRQTNRWRVGGKKGKEARWDSNGQLLLGFMYRCFPYHLCTWRQVDKFPSRCFWIDQPRDIDVLSK